MEQILNFIEFNQYNLPVIIEIFAIYILILWLAVVAWVLKDITTRSDNFLIIVLSALLVAIANVPGLVLYLLIRPNQTIEEDQNKELFYASVIDKNISSCEECGCLVRSDFKYCPNCSHYLVIECHHCQRKINPTWKYCTTCKAKLHEDTNWQKYRIDLLTKIKNRFDGLKLGFSRIYNWLADKVKFDLPEIDFGMTSKTKVMAEKTHVHEKVSKEVKPPKKKKSKRGRPKGKSDKKPRKKRSDAGKKRGSYSKS